MGEAKRKWYWEELDLRQESRRREKRRLSRPPPHPTLPARDEASGGRAAERGRRAAGPSPPRTARFPDRARGPLPSPAAGRKMSAAKQEVEAGARAGGRPASQGAPAPPARGRLREGLRPWPPRRMGAVGVRGAAGEESRAAGMGVTLPFRRCPVTARPRPRPGTSRPGRALRAEPATPPPPPGPPRPPPLSPP